MHQTLDKKIDKQNKKIAEYLCVITVSIITTVITLLIAGVL